MPFDPKRLADVIQAAAKKRPESAFRQPVEEHLLLLAQEAGLELVPQKEVTLGTSGRADTIYNRFVIEWEMPGSFRPSNTNPKNIASIKQVQDYINGLFWKTREKPGRIAGCCTDGHYFIFITKPERDWIINDPVLVTEQTCARFLDFFESLQSGVALIPEYLSQDFSSENVRTQRTVRELYRALELHAASPGLDAVYKQWAEFYGAVTEYEEWRVKLANEEPLRKMVRAFKLTPETLDLTRFFFAVHTFFAILTKLLAYLIVGRYTNLPIPSLQQWKDLSNEDLTAQFKELERGGPFQTAGIRNFLEGDFFAWYTGYVTPELADALRAMVHRLAEYDPATLDLAPAPTQDLLKKLYHRLVSPHIRKALGEYYTPDWLAQRLLNMLEGGTYRGLPDKRLLDPACGSGTFLMLAIKAVRDNSAAQTMDQGELLRKICRNIVGIDLNPLAVTAARTNYLLALGPLLQYRGEQLLEIPVYLADSIMTPSRGEGLFDHGTVPVSLSIGKVAIPRALATQRGVEMLTHLLDEHLQRKPSSYPDQFMAAVEKPLTAAGADWQEDSPTIRALYDQLLLLHDAGRNGMWARILKNAFAPVFMVEAGGFDYVAGNPPWINWQNLPEGYRRGTKDLWVLHGLFVHSGMDTILGKGKKDISTLMTYVAADSYLKDGGTLGFVITQSVFKTSAAGQGFRRFQTRTGTPLNCHFVDDFSEMQLFEGATNRTAVFMLRKGRPTKYPVSYTYWRKKKGEGRQMSFGYDATLKEVTDKTERRQFIATLVNEKDPTSAWLTGPPKAVKAVQKLRGKSDYVAHAGTYSGGANAVYWFDVLTDHGDGTVTARNITAGAKRKIESVQVRLEKDLLYPLLRGRDVRPWSATPSAHLLLVQDVEKRRGIDIATMEEKYPLALRWLRRNEAILRQRASQSIKHLMEKHAFYSMFAIGDYTMSPWKVVWSEQSSSLQLAVVGPLDGRPVLPDHKVMMIACSDESEALYVAGIMNSTPFKFGIASYAIGIQQDPHIIANLRVPKFSSANATHTAISEHARLLRDTAPLIPHHGEESLDGLAARLWAVTPDELIVLRQAYNELYVRARSVTQPLEEEAVPE